MARTEEVEQTLKAERRRPNAERQGGIGWTVLAILAGALFVYAGALKAWDPVGFASDIENYHIVPWWFGVRAAFYLPWLEIVCGLALIFRRFDSGALVLVLTLMLGFIGASIAAKVRGIDVSCGCFGAASKNLSFTWHLVLDFAILAALAALWMKRSRQAAASRP